MITKLGQDLLYKTALFWGGKSIDEDTSVEGLQTSKGYTNLLGESPIPYYGIRVGGRDGMGIRLAAPGLIGIDTRASNDKDAEIKTFSDLRKLYAEKKKNKKK